jgi:hypothetical protein
MKETPLNVWLTMKPQEAFTPLAFKYLTRMTPQGLPPDCIHVAYSTMSDHNTATLLTMWGRTKPAHVDIACSQSGGAAPLVLSLEGRWLGGSMSFRTCIAFNKVQFNTWGYNRSAHPSNTGPGVSLWVSGIFVRLQEHAVPNYIHNGLRELR